MRLTYSKSLQQGTALLIVLFILVLLSTLAVYTAEDEHIAIRRAENQRDAEQSHQVALAGEQWVIKALERDLDAAPTDVDTFADEWAQLQSSIVKIEDGQMAVQAQDESGKFNLNNLMIGKMIEVPDPNAPTGTPLLVESPWYLFFTRLLNAVELDEELADAVVDWVDEDSELTEQDGAEDFVYQSAVPPYLAANQPFSHIAELAMVSGFDKAALDALAPYISALPIDPEDPHYTKVNVHTASVQVLQSLEEDGANAAVNLDVWIKSRPSPGSSLQQAYFTMFPKAANFDKFEQIAALKSDFFSAQSCAKFGRVFYAQQSLLQRNEEDREVTVLSRQRRYNCAVVNP